MSQALYDYQNGMSPEELWARYRQYPWVNNNGETVMQGEPDRTLGPGLPNNVREAVLSTALGGATVTGLRNDKVVGTVINSLLDNSNKLEFTNHELQHSKQIRDNLPIGPLLQDKSKVTIEDYTQSPGEMQARMAGHRSVMPTGLLDMIHPYTQMYPDNEPLDVTYDKTYTRRLFENNLLSTLKDKNKIAETMARYDKLSNLDSKYKNSESDEFRKKTMEDKIPVMKGYSHKAKNMVGNTLLDSILERGRKLYYPPMVSQ